MSWKHNNRSRLFLDMMDLLDCSLPGIELKQFDESDMNHFMVTVAGPANTPFESGTFKLRFHVPTRFPFSAPNVNFATSVFHPNVYYDGAICVNVLNEWYAATTLLEVAECVQALLAAPNPTSPLNVTASVLMDADISMFNDTVRMWTAVHADGLHRPPWLQRKLNQVLEISNSWSEEEALRKLSEHNWDVSKTLQ